MVSISKLTRFFSQGHERSVRAKKNILALVLRKGIGIGISFLMVPLLIEWLNPTRYGVWLTVSSFISWFYIFDIGLGNGLRNKFAEALAKNEHERAKTLVSTTYAILSLISLGLLVVFALLYGFINWSKVFNTPIDFHNEVTLLVLIVFAFFCLQFVVKIISTILTADQKPAIAGFFNTISSAVALLAIFLFSPLGSGNLVQVGIIMSGTNLLVPFIASIFFFKKRYRAYSPSFASVDFKYARDLMGLGFKFFIIQIGALIIYSTNNIIISHLFSPADVTVYNVAFKYFSIITIGFSIVVTPFWSAYTEAFHKNDLGWIRRTIQKQVWFWALSVIALVVMVFSSDFVYRIWVGEAIRVPFSLTLGVALYVAITTWNSIYVSFINGVGKVKIQFYSAVFGAIVNIPLCILLAKTLNMGIVGIILATCCTAILAAVWTPTQYFKIINNRATGIWNK